MSICSLCSSTGQFTNLDMLADPDDPLAQRTAELLQFRFAGVDALAGHAVGNLLLTGLMELTNDPVTALDHACTLVRAAATGASQNGVMRVGGIEAALKANWAASALDNVSIPASGLISDIHGAADYRAHLIKVMAQRAVTAAG